MKLRPYQQEAIESLFDFFENNGGTDRVTGFPIKANPVIALPCGAGKSLIIAEFFKRALQTYPQTRGVMVTHVKTLIRQNHKKMLEAWSEAPIGIYSAGLKKKDNFQPIIFGGIRSMVKKYPIFGYRDFAVIDENHLVSPDAETSYIKFLWELMYGIEVEPGVQPTDLELQKALKNPNCNPYLKVIGLSATPYRMGLGWLTNGPIFTKIAYNLCNVNGFNRLIAEGYLCPIHAKPTEAEIDKSKVNVRNGEYDATEAENEAERIIFKALKELVEKSYDRKCGLIFAAGIKNAEHICELMNSTFGEECVLVHSGNEEFPRHEKENDKALELWINGDVKWLVNVNAVTTGVDNPKVDIGGIFRLTKSSPLWVQILGRFTRPVYADGYDLNDFNQRMEAIKYGGKPNALVLDFAGNCKELGPINDPKIPKIKGESQNGEMPVKICSACGTYNHASARECLACGLEFPINNKLSSRASELELLRSEMPIVESFNVMRVVYSEYTTKAQQRNMIKVAYHCDRLKTFFEFVTVESKIPGGKVDYAVKKGRDWFRQRHSQEPPLLNEQVLLVSNQLRLPVRLNVWVNKQYPEVLGVEF